MIITTIKSGGGKSVLAWGGSGVVAAGGSAPFRYGDNVALNATLGTVAAPQLYIEAPFSGTLRNMIVRASAGTGGATSVDITVRVNDANTPITARLADPAVTVSDVTNSAAVTQGQRISIGLTRFAGVPASVIWSITLELTA